jgi:hypothetical protein
MSRNKEQIIAVIYACVDELNALMGNNHKWRKFLETIILKDSRVIILGNDDLPVLHESTLRFPLASRHFA